MSRLIQSLRQLPVCLSSLVPVKQTVTHAPATASTCLKLARCSSYKAYTDFETPSPYKKKEPYNYGYKYKLYDGGILPRPEGKFEDESLPMPKVKAADRDQWTSRKALFGQNDYIDLLGDGSIHPVQLMKGPVWLRGYKGNELQRLTRRLKYQYGFLKEYYPTELHNIQKRIFFLYKKFNTRKRSTHWGGRRVSAVSRIDNIYRFR